MMRAVGGGISKAVADAAYEAFDIVIPASPTTGQTVSFENTSVDQVIFLTPAGSLATLTVTFPNEATSRLGQIIRIATSQAVLALTLNGATTIMNSISSLTASDCFSFLKVAANTWVKLE